MPPGVGENSWSTRNASDVIGATPPGSLERFHAFHALGTRHGPVLGPRLDVQAVTRLQTVVDRFGVLEQDGTRQAEQDLVVSVGMPVVCLVGHPRPLPGMWAVLGGEQSADDLLVRTSHP